MRSHTDYSLGTDRRLFVNISVRDPRHNSDHYMVMGCLDSAPLREHAIYLGGRKRLPLRPPTALTRGGGIFAALRRSVPKPLVREASNNVWILVETWRLVDKRVSTCQDLAKDQSLIWRLVCAIKSSLRDDRQRQAEEAGAEVGKLMGSEAPLHWEDWHRIKWWYKAAVDRALSPAWVTLERITAEQVELYSYVPPPDTNISISVEPFPVDDSVPTEDEIEWEVKLLLNRLSRGPLGMRAKHLKRWLAEVRKALKY